MANSEGHSSREGPEQSLLSWLREGGSALEAASPPFDAATAAARLRDAARGQGLLLSDGGSADILRNTGPGLEEEAPPFDVEAGVARLREAALARGLLFDNASVDAEPAVSLKAPPGHERFDAQGSERRPSKHGQDDLDQADRLAAARIHFAKSADVKAGTSGRPPIARGMARTGKVTAQEISAARDHYVKPGLFGKASSALRKQRVLALSGAAGSGKRASAIALLRRTTDKPLIILSPAVSLDDLATRRYQEGLGYVVIDWQDPQRMASSQGFIWHTVRDQVAAAGAYLVVTTETWIDQEETISHFQWEPPSPRRVLAAYLVGTQAEARIDEAVSKLPDGCTLSSVVSLAGALAADAELDAALSLLRDDSAEQVRKWFDNDHPLEDILKVTALAFAAGQDERVVEAMIYRLRERAELTGMRSTHRGPIPQAKAERLRANELITRTKVSVEGSDHTLDFRTSGSRYYVLAELYRGWDSRFWDVIRQWLTYMIETEVIESAIDLQIAVAAGLADLALIDVDQVEGAYLNPWAAGEVGWVGQMISAYLLWWMSFTDSLAPTALRIAEGWANGTNNAQIWTAVMALSGELGAAYLNEALETLWRLITVPGPHTTDAIGALAQLFATLVNMGQDTTPLLHLLGTNANSPSPREATELAVLVTLSTKDPRSGLPAVALSMHADRRSHRRLAHLWVRMLLSSSGQKQALVALVDALTALQQISATPEEDARAFGSVLAEVLPSDRHEWLARLVTDWRMRSAKSRRHPGADITPSLTLDLEQLLSEKNNI